MPRGEGFVTFPIFRAGYEALKQGTNGFSAMNDLPICGVITKCPIAFVVLRAMLGFTPPEWAYLASQASKTNISQGFIRTLDRKIRSKPMEPLRTTAESADRIRKLVSRPAVSSRMEHLSFSPSTFIGWIRPTRKEASPACAPWHR